MLQTFDSNKKIGLDNILKIGEDMKISIINKEGQSVSFLSKQLITIKYTYLGETKELEFDVIHLYSLFLFKVDPF